MQKDDEVTFKGLFLPLTAKKVIVYIFLIGFVVFFNSIFNPFLGDDNGQIVNNPLITKTSNIPSFFYQSLVYSGIDTIKILSIYYKPLMFTIFTLLHSFFGYSPVAFHLLQIILHISNTIIVFFIFSRFLKRGLSFFLSLIFLVHPINSESVIYIADMQEVLFVFFGLLSLLLILNAKDKLFSFYRVFFMALLLLFSLFSKETGILFFGIIFIYTLLFTRSNFKRIITGSILTTLVYIIFRIIASSFSVLEITQPSLIQKASLIIKLQTLPQMVFYYISKLFLPINLAIGQDWTITKVSFSNFYLPLLSNVLFFSLIAAFGIYIYKNIYKLFKPYIFFACWFCLGLMIHLQLIPLDLTVADRWFYFPMIGLLGIVGLLANVLYKQSKENILIRNVALFAFCIIFLSLSFLTIIRNSQWNTWFQLLSHDVKFAQSPILNSYYGGMLLLSGELDKAKPYLEKSVLMEPQLGYNLNNLGALYEHKKDYAKAKALYSRNIKLNSHNSNSYQYVSYVGLAHIALNENNPKEAKEMAQMAIKTAPLNNQANEYLAISEYKLGEEDEALDTIQKLYDRVPNQEIAQLFVLIKNHKPFTVNPSSGAIIIY
jgi:protein O-mannosyl-transferase